VGAWEAAALGLGGLTLLVWLGLWLGHASFWRLEFPPAPPPPAVWPAVTAVIPARNEAGGIGETLASLAAQEYPGEIRVVVVDDHSDDGTATAAQAAAAAAGLAGRLTLLAAEPLPPGWAGKVWAMHQGLTRLAEHEPGYVLFSDADIRHGPGVLRELVGRAEAEALDLASLMVRLRCETAAERLLIPAFVFFFRLLYPFRRVNDPAHPLAGAAGGTMLVRAAALRRIGGLKSIRGALIDDCALAAAVKRGGHRLWLGLAVTSESTRGYGSVRDVLAMIARTAYTQLGYSPLRLAGCVGGLALTFLAPPALAAAAPGPGRWLGLAAWGLMAGLYLPMVRFYRQSPLWAPLLPLTAALYLWATLASAWAYHRGRGGGWKGRVLGKG